MTRREKASYAVAATALVVAGLAVSLGTASAVPPPCANPAGCQPYQTTTTFPAPPTATADPEASKKPPCPGCTATPPADAPGEDAERCPGG